MGKNERGIVAIIFAWIAMTAGGARGAAAPASLRIAYPAPTASFLPLWTAHDAGFFKKNNFVGGAHPGWILDPGHGGDAGQSDRRACRRRHRQRGGAACKALPIWRSSAPMFIRGSFPFMRVPSIKDVAQLRGKKMARHAFRRNHGFCCATFSQRTGLRAGEGCCVSFKSAARRTSSRLWRTEWSIPGVMSVPYLFVAQTLGTARVGRSSHRAGSAMRKRRWSPREVFSRDKRDIVGQIHQVA